MTDAELEKLIHMGPGQWGVKSTESIMTALRELQRRRAFESDGAGSAAKDDARDAARYRYLKQHHLQLGPDCWIRTGDDLDEAIDAAISTPSEGER